MLIHPPWRRWLTHASPFPIRVCVRCMHRDASCSSLAGSTTRASDLDVCYVDTMVHDFSGRYPGLSGLALVAFTERVLSEIGVAKTSPSRIVSTFCRRASQRILFLPFSLAV